MARRTASDPAALASDPGALFLALDARARRLADAGDPDAHRFAALALLTFNTLDGGRPLDWREGGFLGHCAVADALSDKQALWLRRLGARLNDGAQ